MQCSVEGPRYVPAFRPVRVMLKPTGRASEGTRDVVTGLVVLVMTPGTDSNSLGIPLMVNHPSFRESHCMRQKIAQAAYGSKTPAIKMILTVFLANETMKEISNRNPVE
ncbi:hypothetical protein EVAR_89659_1 [Eumeta japonica]|uniref:Uncharacterized protein n=1 Tax=Eumeta variegata TaxID=151549 RepID=A0A4C1YB33_EUMVA|nr:hypothetical protein EVAR_89659_1 [Eumeta japonica]